MIKKIFLCFCALLLSSNMILAQKEITGTVNDANGPLPGATVLVKGTTTGVTTDFDGNYTITVPGDEATLVFSYVGFVDQEIVVGDQTVINVTLREDVQSLDEVVVTAQGIKKSKKALGYAITKLDSDAVEERPEADLARTLQGKIAGVRITQSNGQTGSNSPITVRGISSITGSNGPLIVVNNVPFNGLLRDINPNDIENISILKGLNAAVLYGSEGRNGVILIQTKSGSTPREESRVRATVSSTTYINTVSQLPEYQNTYGQGQEGNFIPTFLSVWGPAFSELDQVVHPYAGFSDIFPEFENATVPYEAQPDNVRNLFNTGTGTIHSVSVSAAKDKVGFNLSAGFAQEEGIIGNNDLERFNISLGGNAQLTDKLNVSATFNYSTRQVNLIQSLEVFRRILYLPRNIDITQFPFQNPTTGESIYYRNDTNPLWTLNNTGIFDDVVRTFTTFNASYQFNDAFSLTYRVGLDNEQSDSFDFSNRGGFNDDIFRTGFLNLGYRKENTVDQTILLGYNKSLTDDLNMEVQLGANSRLTSTRSVNSESQNQIVFGFLRPDNFSNTRPTEFVEVDENIAGVYGQVQLAYKNYLYGTLSGRNDWGSTVERENRSLFYPGVSVSFIPTSAFNFNTDLVNYLKVRGAYATSSGFPDAFRTRNTLLIDRNRFATPGPDGTVFPITNRFGRIVGNPDLRPELHREFEVGVEAKLFNNRVTLETSLYKRISRDQIVDAPLSPSSGFDLQVINLGRVDNEGIEVNLGIDIFRNSDGFNWNMQNIFTADESLVVETTADGGRIQLFADRFAVEGRPFGAIVGDFALRDAQGNLLISGNGGSTRVGEVIVSSDIGLQDRVIGDPNPDWRLSTINNFSYKNFTLSTQLEYTHGGDISSRSVEDLLERGVTRDTESRNGSFVIPGFLADDATGEPLLDANGNQIPNTIQLNGLRTVFSNFYNANDLSLWDASVFRIREIALGYTYNRKEGSKLPFEKINFTLSGRNLWFYAPNFPKYSNFDPESDGGLGRNNVPSTKRFALGISATF
ncbi:SusC/RagA family TonB-linked outer membrane protein [Flavobacteriaceae bacterium R38]|nr:SusC/RagA family TonB-linked outer membrane protein [Flavobacteriaceae bacterium R38]